MRLIIVFSIFFLSISSVHAISIRTLSVGNDRFTGNTPGASQNASFQYSALDFSGVGWDSAATQKSITLISDRHFVAAAHYSIGSSVNFRDNSGAVLTYMVSSLTNISNADNPLSGNSDLVVGTLSTAVASGIDFYPILDPILSPLAQKILIYGQQGRIGESTIISEQNATVSGVNGRVLGSHYAVAAGDDDDAYFTNGDSGGPSFIVGLSGELILAGVHWAVEDDAVTDPIAIPAANRYNFDTNVPDYLDQINSISGLTATTSSNIIAVPEPGSSLLILMGGFLISLRRKKN